MARVYVHDLEMCAPYGVISNRHGRLLGVAGRRVVTGVHAAIRKADLLGL